MVCEGFEPPKYTHLIYSQTPLTARETHRKYNGASFPTPLYSLSVNQTLTTSRLRRFAKT